MVIAYNAKLAGTPLGPERHLPEPIRPPLPFDVDQLTIRRLKSQQEWRAF